MSQDPTRDEMLATLTVDELSEFDDFDREEAIYWFANDYHSGQASNLYSALSISDYRPGPIARGPSNQFLYQVLVDEYA